MHTIDVVRTNRGLVPVRVDGEDVPPSGILEFDHDSRPPSGAAQIVKVNGTVVWDVEVYLDGDPDHPLIARAA